MADVQKPNVATMMEGHSLTFQMKIIHRPGVHHRLSASEYSKGTCSHFFG